MEENTINVDNEVVETEVQQAEQPSYTQADLDRMISKMADKFEKKYEKKYKQQVSLSGLDEKERAIAEKDMALKEMEERLRSFEMAQARLEFTKVLSARGLDNQLIDIINISDDDMQNQRNIDILDKVIKSQVAKEVQARIGATLKTPTTSQSVTHDVVTKEMFKTMSLAEQSELYKQNKELYMSLIK